MNTKPLITLTALLLPVGMVQAQPGLPEKPSEPTQNTTEAGKAQATPATDADLAKGKAVNDPSGQPVGTVDSVTASGVVLMVGERRIQVPKEAIGKTETGLVITTTRAELEAAAEKIPPK